MGSITIKEIEQIYPLAKGIHKKKLDAIDKLHTNAGMNRNSADFFIQSFLAMMEGRRYEKNTNAAATRYFLEKIHKDFGPEALERALLSVKKHIIFYEGATDKTLPGIKKIYQEFLKRLR